MTDFLLELRSEEIPARMQGRAKEDLARLFGEALAKAGLAVESVETFATPRRLALIAKGLPLETEAVAEETKGPKVGAPPQAMEGFLRKTGLTQDQLAERDGVYFAIAQKPGRNTADVLAEAIPAIIRAFPWPKSQRWGAASVSTESLRWVRPLQGIVALFGDDVVDCEIDGIVSGAATMGHRFHHSGPITIGNAGDYVEKLRACHVIVHFSERTAIIRDGAEAAAKAAGLVLVPDEGLVTENAGLTEWPVPMLGRFDPAFLDVPQEVIQLTARMNQKYFVCNDADSKLANAFVCTANIVAHDGGAAIVAGNEKVLAARLSDAKFFWEQDLKVKLDVQAKKLSQITFHEKLGTVADKVERVAKLARWLVQEEIVKSSPSLLGEGDRPQGGGGAASKAGALASATPPSSDASAPAATSPSKLREDLASMAERAAQLCKADLVTGMVGEFPELQGIMGGYYARAQGEPDAVADAVRDHYKPVGQGDDVPTAPVTVAVSLADKLDTLAGFFSVNERPTGSKDPFALRRAAISIIQQVLGNELRVPFIKLLIAASHSWYQFEAQRRGRDAYANVYFGLEQAKGHAPDYYEVERILRARIPSNDDIREQAFEGIRLLDEFFFDRLKVQQKEAGTRHDLIDAVAAMKIADRKEDDLVRLLARVKALQGFVATQEGADLLAGYKRAANILKSSGDDKNPVTPAQAGVHHASTLILTDAIGSSLRWSDGSVLGEAETLLLTALNTAEPKAASAIAAEDFEGAMAALASLRAPIDAFFDGVMVNDPDPEKRAFRVGLLTRFRDAVCQVADFSRIEG